MESTLNARALLLASPCRIVVVLGDNTMDLEPIWCRMNVWTVGPGDLADHFSAIHMTKQSSKDHRQFHHHLIKPLKPPPGTIPLLATIQIHKSTIQRSRGQRWRCGSTAGGHAGEVVRETGTIGQNKDAEADSLEGRRYGQSWEMMSRTSTGRSRQFGGQAIRTKLGDDVEDVDGQDSYAAMILFYDFSIMSFQTLLQYKLQVAAYSNLPDGSRFLQYLSPELHIYYRPDVIQRACELGLHALVMDGVHNLQPNVTIKQGQLYVIHGVTGNGVDADLLYANNEKE
ncbi:hypothetical protein OSTOST_08824 [Ostertagia ostertagi]